MTINLQISPPPPPPPIKRKKKKPSLFPYINSRRFADVWCKYNQRLLPVISTACQTVTPYVPTIHSSFMSSRRVNYKKMKDPFFKSFF